jgi:spermidine/putrescine transport system ATP-binding protein
MVFQNLALFPTMNVYRNIAFGLEMRGVSSKEIKQKVFEYLEIIDLLPIETYAGKTPDMLSGGEKQRVAIARSLILEPAVLLLDEPLANLDLKLREQMKIELKIIQHRVKTTFIYVTHDQTEACAMSNRILVMKKGHLHQIGAPEELYNTPESEFVAKFIGDSNHMTGVVNTIDGDMVGYTSGESTYYAIAKDTVKKGEAVNVYLRVENVSVVADSAKTKSQNVIEGRIRELVFEGSAKRIICEYGNGKLMNILLFGKRSAKKYKIGQKITFGWNIEDAKAYRKVQS